MRLSVFRGPGPTPVATALSRESRAQAGALVVIDPLTDKFLTGDWMGDDVVEFPRGRAKVFTEDEARAYLRRERRHLAALARKGFLRLLARVLPERQPPAPSLFGKSGTRRRR